MYSENCAENNVKLSSTPQGAVCGNTLAKPLGLENFRKLTYGERMVGLGYNPNCSKEVEKIKRLFAEVLDLIKEKNMEQVVHSYESNQLKESAIKEVISAQMWAVKYITFKD